LCTGPGALGDSPTRPLKRLVNAIGKVPLLQLHEIREQGVKRPAQITGFLARRFTSNDPRSLKAMTQHLIDAPDIVDDVVATHTPTWVGRGAGDDAWPHDVQAAMAERLGTRVHVIADAAHSPAVENPAGLMDAWVPFLQAHTRS
jgi:pimeloyl-ACP methyl ester carboxylesterase